MGSPSCGGDVAVYVFGINQLRLPTLSFLFCSCVYFCLYGPFNFFHFKISPNNSPLSHSVLPVLLLLPYWSFQLYVSISLWKSPSSLNPNPAHQEFFTVTYQKCCTKGMVHNRLMTYQTLWHTAYVTQRADPIIFYLSLSRPQLPLSLQHYNWCQVSSERCSPYCLVVLCIAVPTFMVPWTNSARLQSWLCAIFSLTDNSSRDTSHVHRVSSLFIHPFSNVCFCCVFETHLDLVAYAPHHPIPKHIL